MTSLWSSRNRQSSCAWRTSRPRCGGDLSRHFSLVVCVWMDAMCMSWTWTGQSAELCLSWGDGWAQHGIRHMGYMASSPSVVSTRPPFGCLCFHIRWDYIITAICSVWRFGSLDPTPSRDSRCTFPITGAWLRITIALKP